MACPSDSQRPDRERNGSVTSGGSGTAAPFMALRRLRSLSIYGSSRSGFAGLHTLQSMRGHIGLALRNTPPSPVGPCASDSRTGHCQRSIAAIARLHTQQSTSVCSNQRKSDDLPFWADPFEQDG